MKSADEVPGIANWGLTAIGLIAANAAVLVIALIQDLSLIQILMVYCFESVWIGVFSALRLILASVVGDPYRNSWANVSPGASLMASIVIIFMSSSAFFSISGAAVGFVLYAEHLLSESGTSTDTLLHLPLVIGTSLVFVASHGISFAVNFLFMGEFRRVRVGELVAFPFKRSLALLVSILVGLGIVGLLPMFASAKVFVLIVVALKLILDLYLYRDERRIPESSGSDT